MPAPNLISTDSIEYSTIDHHHMPAEPQSCLDMPSVKNVHCTGTPFEIGFTHGSAASSEIHCSIKIYTQFFSETAKITWQQARERAISQHSPTLELQWPEIVEEMRSIAEGAGGGLTRDDILTLNVRTEIGFTNYIDGCTSIAQSTKHGEIYLAQNWDMVPDLHKGMVFLHIEPLGTDFALMFLDEAGIVGKIGMNNKGFGLCMNALRSGAINQNYMPVHIMSRRLLQYATNVDTAQSIIKDFGLASSINYVLADQSGKLVDIECSPLGNVLITPRDGYLAHTNHFYGPNRPKKLKDHPFADTVSRLRRMQKLTDNDNLQGIPATFKSLRARLSDTEGIPVSICRSVPTRVVGLERLITLSTIIMELTSCTGKVTIGRPCDDLPVVDWSF